MSYPTTASPISWTINGTLSELRSTHLHPTGLNAEAFERAMYYPFDELAKATAHIPTHQRWRRLTSILQDRLDAERKVLEQDHAEAVNGAARALLERQ